jgi:hypothetical protein
MNERLHAPPNSEHVHPLFYRSDLHITASIYSFFMCTCISIAALARILSLNSFSW